MPSLMSTLSDLSLFKPHTHTRAHVSYLTARTVNISHFALHSRLHTHLKFYILDFAYTYVISERVLEHYDISVKFYVLFCAGHTLISF